MLSGGCAAQESAPPADGGSYASPRDILAKVQAVGVQCGGYEPIPHPVGAKERGDCQSVGGVMFISTYEREGDVQAQIDFQRTDRQGISMLAGRNWTISLRNGDALRSAQSVLGGHLIIEN